MHPQIPAVKSPKQKSPASRMAGFVPSDSSPRGRGSRRGSPARDRTGSPVNPVPTGRFRHRPNASRPRGLRSTARPGPAVLAAPSPLQRGWRGRQASETKRSATPGAVGSEAGPCLPPSLTRPPLASPHPQSPCRPGPTPSSPRGRRSGPAMQGAAGRPRSARAEEGAAAATMSARPSLKLGASGQCAAAARAERAPRPTPPTPAE